MRNQRKQMNSKKSHSALSKPGRWKLGFALGHDPRSADWHLRLPIEIVPHVAVAVGRVVLQALVELKRLI
jgi:hypothetical protein